MAAVACWTCFSTAGAAALPSPVPEDTWTTNGSVNEVLRAGDQLILGGDFTRVGPRTGPSARFDGTTGGFRGAGVVEDGTIREIVPDGAGGYYAAGSFLRAAGQDRAGLVHVLANGTVDPTFDAAFDGIDTVEGNGIDHVLLAGTTLYAAGSFTGVDGVARTGLVALDAATGALMADFAPTFDSLSFISDIALGDGVLYVVGGFTMSRTLPSAITRSHVAAVDATTGALLDFDPTLPQEGLGDTRTVAYRSGTVYFGGFYGAASAVAATGAAGSWSPAITGFVFDLVVDGDRVYLAGSLTGPDGIYGVARTDAATGAVDAWDPDVADGSVVDRIMPDGDHVLLLGLFDTVGGQPRDYLARVAKAGAAVSAWDPEVDYSYAAARTGDEIIIGGGWGTAGGVQRENLAAIDLRTGEATAFGPRVDDEVGALALAGTTLYVGGRFEEVDGQPRDNLAAVELGSGALVDDWNPGTDDEVFDLEIVDSTIYAGGRFEQTAGSVERAYLAGYDLASGALSPWDPNPDGWVLDVAPAGETLFAVGRFTQIGGQARARSAALRLSDAGATGFTADLSGGVVDGEGQAVQISGDTVYLGGRFDAVNGQERKRFAVVDRSTGAVRPIAPGVDTAFSFEHVASLALNGDTLYVGGTFGVFGGQIRSGLAAIDTGSGAVVGFGPDLDASPVADLDTEGGALYAGGSFDHVGPVKQRGFAVFGTAPSVLTPPAVSGTALVGGTLTCTPGTYGESTPATRTYAWTRDGTAIPAATGITHGVSAADAGRVIRCVETVTNRAGSGTGESAPVVPAGPASPGECANGIDDDRDGLLDAADPQCALRGVETPRDSGLLACAGQRLVLVDVIRQGRRVRLAGLADPTLAGQRVNLFAGAKRVGRARIGPTGAFSARVPRAKRASTRYQARLGTLRSKALKLDRKSVLATAVVTGDRVRLTARVPGRRFRRAAVQLQVRVGCGRFRRAATGRVKRRGRVRISAPAPQAVDLAIFRARIRARGGRTTFTLPRAVILR